MSHLFANTAKAGAMLARLYDQRELARRRVEFEEAGVRRGMDGAEQRLENWRADLGRIDLQIYQLETGDVL